MSAALPLTLGAGLALLAHPAAATPSWVFVCARDNGLLVAARESGLDVSRARSVAAARALAHGRPVLILADSYPEAALEIDAAQVEGLLAAGGRVYLEYAGAPGEVGSELPWGRAVVCGDWLSGDLADGALLAAHSCRALPYSGDGEVVLRLARVAGYDRAEFGLPAESLPLLALERNGQLVVATTALSNFARGRYAPSARWDALWARILGHLAGCAPPDLRHAADPRPARAQAEPLPPDAERQALLRGTGWYDRAGLLLDEERLAELAPAMSRGEEEAPWRGGVAGDGSRAMLEGFSARIAPDGSQPIRAVIRNDCLGETALALRFSGAEGDAARSRALLDYIAFDSLIQRGVRGDPTHPAYGLMAWGVTSWAWERATYGDDNARALLGMIGASALAGDGRWDDSIARALLANLRTTGALGYRGGRIDIPDLEANGWRHYHERAVVDPSAHYEGYLWSCFLLAGERSGKREFLDKAEAGIRDLMARYPAGWELANNSMALERARALLPLAWLVRVEDTEEHRAWLERIATDLLADMQPCGAIRESLGAPGSDHAAVPSNEAFGTGETSILQRNGDPVCDLLYTMNFAFLGLHEAAAATGDPRWREAENRIADFLCRIQVRSEAHPELDGAWFRGFDYDKWDYWGNSADIGWGVWCVETGWTQAWIVTVLGLRERGESLWELASRASFGPRIDAVAPEFAIGDGGPWQAAAAPVATESRGASYSLEPPADARYPDAGGALTDGLGWPGTAHTRWCGWQGEGLTVTLDLGRVRHVPAVFVRILDHADLGIFAPRAIEVALSDDGVAYTPAASTPIEPLAPGDRSVLAREVVVPVGGEARFVRVRLPSVGAIPAWHGHAGIPAWLFVDEVGIR